MFAVFAFDLETCNLKNHFCCEAYRAGVYYLNRFFDCFNGDLTEKELEIEKQHVHVFDRENGNPLLDMINYALCTYKGKPKILTKRR